MFTRLDYTSAYYMHYFPDEIGIGTLSLMFFYFISCKFLKFECGQMNNGKIEEQLLFLFTVCYSNCLAFNGDHASTPSVYLIFINVCAFVCFNLLSSNKKLREMKK